MLIFTQVITEEFNKTGLVIAFSNQGEMTESCDEGEYA